MPRFPFIHMKPNRKASLVLVKDNWEACKNEAELKLYKYLREGNYYPTPHYKVEGYHVNVALVPYRLAFIERNHSLDEKKITRSFRKKQWHVLFYDSEKLIKDTHEYLQMVQQHTDNTKNVPI